MPDTATSRYVIRALLQTSEDMWLAAKGDDYNRMRVARAACIIIVGYFAVMRGEDIGKADFGAMVKYWDKGMRHPDHPHVPLMLSGRFKGETGQKLFCQPLEYLTDGGCNISI